MKIEALKKRYNLADAHTHQSQSASQQRDIIDHLPALWNEAERMKQVEMEERFLKAFFRVAKQEEALENKLPLLVYASSIAMVMVANYLMKKDMSIALLEPCFDNIHDILMHMHIPMQPLDESWLYDADEIYATLEANIPDADAIFIVEPNNPTGFTLFSKDCKALRELVRFCVDRKKLLIFDFCFMTFIDHSSEISVPPVYKILDESGVSYLAIEDTGKTWPLQDTKVAMLKSSPDIYDEIYYIHTAYLLNVSPFILNLITQYLLDSEKDVFESVYSLLERNREIVKKELKGSLLEYVEPIAKTSVAWFRITVPSVTSTVLQKYIVEAQDVYVLPGTYFFWNDPSKGEAFIRIALARNSDIFEEAVTRLRKALDSYAA